MQRLRIHPQGPTLSRLAAGVWRWHTLQPNQIEELINTSLAAGVTTFDHADIYGNYSCEEIFGNVLKEKPALRDKIEIVTKCGIKLLSDKRPFHKIKHYDTSKEHIIWSVENSLKMLGTDRIDLLLLHRPDPLLNPIDVVEAFATLKKQGKVLHFGVSNFTPSQFEMLQAYLSFPLVTNQIELSLFNITPFFDGTSDTLMKHQVSPMAWSPLGGGKHFENEMVMNSLNVLAKEYGCSVTQLLLAWLLKHPSAVLPILGTTQNSRIKEGAKAVEVVLEKQHWFEMLKIGRGKDVA
jgi:predicted oxidoreductase